MVSKSDSERQISTKLGGPEAGEDDDTVLGGGKDVGLGTLVAEDEAVAALGEDVDCAKEVSLLEGKSA